MIQSFFSPSTDESSGPGPHYFRSRSNLAAIALINFLDDLMLSCGVFVDRENRTGLAAGRARSGTKNQVSLPEDRGSSRELDIKI